MEMRARSVHCTNVAISSLLFSLCAVVAGAEIIRHGALPYGGGLGVSKPLRLALRGEDIDSLLQNADCGLVSALVTGEGDASQHASLFEQIAFAVETVVAQNTRCQKFLLKVTDEGADHDSVCLDAAAELYADMVRRLGSVPSCLAFGADVFVGFMVGPPLLLQSSSFCVLCHTQGPHSPSDIVGRPTRVDA